VGKAYWTGLMQWIEETMLEKEKNISPEDLNLYKIVDSTDEAVEYIEDFFTSHSLTPNF
jgi:predicted Rossmann-fold nucleotide-binding protein